MDALTPSHSGPLPPPDAHDAVPTNLEPISTRTVTVAGLILVAVFVALFLIGFIPRHRRLSKLEAESAAANDARPTVEIATPRRSAKSLELWLPADARSNQETPIFPRAT